MALIRYNILICESKSHPACTGQFQREIKRGRKPTVCPLCEPVKVASRAPKIAAGQEYSVICPCGAEFKAIKGGRGRKREKCDACREQGLIYRINDSGEIDVKTVQDQADEERERKEALGRERADALVQLMAPLLQKKHRVVIPH